MRVLVLGGTRFIGPHVVRRLVADGHDVALFNRGQSRPDVDIPDCAVTFSGDRSQLAAHRPSFVSYAPDVVIDLFPYTEADAQAVMDVLAGIAKRVVAISSCDVYCAFGRVNRIEEGPVEEGLINEESPLCEKRYPFRGVRDDRADYDKVLVERVVMGNKDLPGTVLRLPMVYGPGDYQHRMYAHLKRMLDGRRVIVLEDGLAKWRWTRGYVEDVAAAIALAATDRRAAGQIYNVGEPVADTMKTWVERIAAGLGWDGEIISVPADHLPPTLKWDINTNQHIDIDTSKIRRELGFTEQVSPQEAVCRTIEWERNHPPARLPAEMFDYEAEDAVMAKWRAG